MKQEFEMQQSEMDFILDINKHNSNTVMMIGGVDFSHNLTDAINAYWKELGDKYGFKWDTVEGSSKGALFFLATPQQTKIQKREMDISMRQAEIDEMLEKIETLKSEISELKSTV